MFLQNPTTRVCNPWPAGPEVVRELKFCGPRKEPDFQALQFFKGIARARLKVLCSRPRAEQIFRQI